MFTLLLTTRTCKHLVFWGLGPVCNCGRSLGSQGVLCNRNGMRYLPKMEEERGRNKGNIQRGSSVQLVTCKTYSYPGLNDSASEEMLLHGTPAANTELKAKPGFNKRCTQRALYGSSVYLKGYQDNTASSGSTPPATS